jgi:hypothetical protein
MESLNDQIQEYRLQLGKGHIQKAYKGIMAFMSSLKSDLEKSYPDYFTSALYFGYMDMTYFAFTPPILKDKKLKIAIVYLHEEGRFEAWLGGNNRKIQGETIARFEHQDLGKYKLSQVQPGVDSIIESILVEQPNFDKLKFLKEQIEEKTITFIQDMVAILAEC